MTDVLRIGGSLAAYCPTCRSEPGDDCRVLDKSDGRPTPWHRRRPHAARVKLAPPEQDARGGDLVVTCLGGREILAIILSVFRDQVAVRTWSDALGWTVGHGTVAPWQVLRHAPDDSTTAAARAALAGAA